MLNVITKGAQLLAQGTRLVRVMASFASAVTLLVQQFDIIQEMVQNPIQSIIQQVVGGAWRGDGADAFVESLQNVFIPRITETQNTIDGMRKNLVRSNEIVEQADTDIRGLLESRLSDAFNFF